MSKKIKIGILSLIFIAYWGLMLVGIILIFRSIDYIQILTGAFFIIMGLLIVSISIKKIGGCHEDTKKEHYI